MTTSEVRVNQVKVYRNNFIAEKNKTTSGRELKNENKSQTNDKQDNKSKKKKIAIIISLILLIVSIIIIIFFLIFVWLKRKKQNKNIYSINYEEYIRELMINTKVDDYTRLNINQTEYEDIIIEGKKIQLSVYRKTYYDIYIISVEDCNENYEGNCKKYFTASIAEVSQCISFKNENCEPKTLVDLSNNNKNNLRNLGDFEKINDLKNHPIALCLINFTDTNNFTSISCHESLKENIKRQILSDLYYFRPNGKLFYKDDEFSVIKEKDKKIIIRKSKGKCNIKTISNTYCDLDMNITKDSNGNLLLFNEIILSNITSDISNGLNKYKSTKLEIMSSNQNDYKKNLFLILNKLELKEEKASMITRKLSSYDNKNLEKEESLFSKEYMGIKIDLNFKYDYGINSESIKAFNYLNYNEHENVLINKAYFSNLNSAIKKLISLSKSGNYIAYLLYEKIKNNLNNLAEEITIKISNLNSLIFYQDLTEIFDSTLILKEIKFLTYNIVEESTILSNQLNTSLNNIENNEIENINYLETNIDNYYSSSYNYLNLTFYNLKELGILMNPLKIFSANSNTYFNETLSSFIKTIQKANNLYTNYWQKESNIIEKETESSLLKDFKDNYSNSIQKQRTILNNLYLRMKNNSLTIINGTEEDYKILENNLNNSNNYSQNILNKIINKVKNVINSKKNENLLMDIDKENFNQTLKESNEIENILYNDDNKDKIFNNIMSKFKENFTNIIKYMNRLKEGKFTLIDDSLKEQFFTTSIKDNIKNDISKCGVDIINTIKKENKEYLTQIKDNINNIVNDSLVEDLNSLIFDLNIFFSEENLYKFSNLYDLAFQTSLNKMKNDILNNQLLIENYYKEFADILEDRVSLFSKFEDFIILNSTKKVSRGYCKKYCIFQNYLSDTKDYLSNHLYNDFFNEYKNITTQIKDILDLIKDSRISELFPEFRQFDFFKKHINNLDNINNLTAYYFSLDKFNNSYLSIINDFKNEQLEKIENITDFFNSHHELIKKIEKSDDNIDDDNDLCMIFKIEIEISGKTLNIDTDQFCAKIASSYDNFKKIINISMYSDENFQNLFNQFNTIIISANETSYNYDSKINKVKDFLISLEKDTIEKNITNDYLSPIQNKIDLIISERYDEKLVKNAYNFYKNNIDGKIENIFNDINQKWNETFISLFQEINNNLPQFKYSIDGFSYMSEIFNTLISNEIIKNYFDSIINLQKNEFNYTILDYYNDLIKIVNSTHKYIINNIPLNDVGFSNIINLRNNEINEVFNKIIEKIISLKNESLDVDNQLNILQVKEDNFFKLEINNYIIKITECLNDRIEEINIFERNISDNQFSINDHLNLENLLNEKQIKAFSEEISDKTFIELNQEKFKEFLKDHWNFDQNEITNKVIFALNNINEEISNNLSKEKRNYISILDKEINSYFTKKSVIEKINHLYSNGLRKLNVSQIEEIKNYINETLNIIKNYLYNESIRINNTLVSYTSDFSKINKTIKDYKNNIFNEIENKLLNIYNDFREKMLTNFYKDYIENALNNYVDESKKSIKDFKKYKLLNSSYDLKEIIDNTIQDLVNEYKEITKKQINYNHQMELKDLNFVEEFKSFINDEIDKQYNLVLFPILKEKAIYNSGEMGYNEYDFGEGIKNNIDSTIQTNLNHIKNIILSIKGENYQVNIKTKNNINGTSYETNNPDSIPFNFSNMNFSEIENLFEKFILSQKEYEKNSINAYIKNIIKTNFIDLVNNILELYGDDYLEREFEYNKIFKIKDLFDNLAYSITQTISYYLYLNSSKIDGLPKELKTKLYNLNNVDLLIQENNINLLELLKTKTDEFINDSKNYLVNNYLTYMKNEPLFSMSFIQEIVDLFHNNLNIIQSDIENDYIHLLNDCLNEKFISKYNQTLNEEAEKLNNLINESREKFISEMEGLFTLDLEEILDEINLQINKTIISIDEYYFHLNLFRIPKELREYLNNYGRYNIKPIYDEFKNTLDEISKNQIILNLEQNSKNYENSLNSQKFIDYTNSSYLNLKESYFDNINNYLNYYYNHFNKNFENEVIKILDNDTVLKEEKNIYDIYIDESFEKLNESSENITLFIQTFQEFDKFDRILTNNINNLNIAFNESKQIIKNYNNEDETRFNNKLYHLNELSLDYYKKINESFYNIKNYLTESILKINDDVKDCINITYETLINKYKNISNEEPPLEEIYSKNEDNLNPIRDNFDIEDTKYFVYTELRNLQKYIKFKFEIVYENNDYKKPKIIAYIINKSRPKTMINDIYSEFGNCARKGILIDTNFNNAGYTLNLSLDTKSTNINATTITNFEKYSYNVEIYETEDSDEVKCFVVAGIKFCINTEQCENKITLSKELLSNNKKELIEYDYILY